MKTKVQWKWLALVVAASLLLSTFPGYASLSLQGKPALAENAAEPTWEQAFESMYQQLTKEYAFTEWKHVDWSALHEKYAPLIGDAQARQDFNAYYIALREFLTEVPDGHVSLNNLKAIDDLYIGGGFGLAVSRLRDGSVIAVWVDESSPAYAAGLRTSAVITEWNGTPIQAALSQVQTIFAGSSATTENLQFKQAQYLTRAPVGATATVTFQNSNDVAAQTVTLTAFDDNRLSLRKSYPGSVLSDKIRSMYLETDDPDPVPEAMVETKTLDGNIVYIKIWGELDADLKGSGTAPSTLELFRKAITQANAQNAGSIILDIRNNLGGLDDMSAAMLGSFYTQKTLYEYQNIYNPATGKREIQPVNGEDALYITPAAEHYGGNIVCLINQKCVSSGEGIAMGIQKLPNGKTLGFYGTSGSFGLAGAEIPMPGGLTVHFPFGQSLDQNHRIQLDSVDGVGGVSPSIRIEMTAQNVLRAATGEDVELEAAVDYLHSFSPATVTP